MRRALLLVALAAALLVSAVAPASAYNSSVHKWVPNGAYPEGCEVRIQILNAADLSGFHGEADIWPDGPDSSGCAYIGIRAQIVKCDGSTSWSSETGKFNPPPGLVYGIFLQYTFGCVGAHVSALQFRTDNDVAHWMPNQVSPPDYVQMTSGGSCTPAYCLSSP